MIKSLKIRNFQSHKNSTLNFVEGVNIIVGLSDSGKSAIIRAIRWVKDNRPSGSSICSRWGGETSVKVILDDCYVERKKGSEELYVLNDQQFKAFRTDVPEEIRKALNMNDINTQYQLDAPFLLSQSSGEVAQRFNKTAKLDKIDSSIKKLNKWETELKNSIKYKKENIISKKKELETFEYLETFEIELEVLEEVERRLQVKTNGRDKMIKLIKQYHFIDAKLEKINNLVQLEEDACQVLSLFEKKEEMEQELDSITQYIEDYVDLEDQITIQNGLIELSSDVESLLALYDKQESLESQFSLLSNTLNSYSRILTKVKENETKQTALITKYNNLIPIGSKCPICGNEIKTLL